MRAIPDFTGSMMCSLLGVMAFPEDLEKAEICACWAHTTCFRLERMVDYRKMSGDTDGIPYASAIVEKAARFPPLYSEWEKATADGKVAGAVSFTMTSLIQDNPDNATWERAIRFVEDTCKPRSLSRSKIESCRQKCASVFHFWAAWHEYKGQIPSELHFTAKAEEFFDVIAGWVEGNSNRGNDRSPAYDNAYHAPPFMGFEGYEGEPISFRKFSIDLQQVPPRLRRGPKKKQSPPDLTRPE